MQFQYSFLTDDALSDINERMQQGLYYTNQLCLRRYRHKEAQQLGDKEEEFILPFLNIVYSAN